MVVVLKPVVHHVHVFLSKTGKWGQKLTWKRRWWQIVSWCKQY